MMLLVSGASKTVNQIWPEHPGRLGRLITPRTGNSLEAMPADMKWGYDNDGFAYFDKDRWQDKLWRWIDEGAVKDNCLFVTCPDMVANAFMTERLFVSWHGWLRREGFPVAFVLQDGVEHRRIWWRRLDWIFVGGGTPFKESEWVLDRVKEAKDKGKHVHVGRVNSIKRAKRFLDAGADSLDGTQFSMFPNTYIPWFMGFLQDPENPPPQGRKRTRKQKVEVSDGNSQNAPRAA